jgi:hypothetical protein
MMPRETCFSDEVHLPEEGKNEGTKTRAGFADACGAGHHLLLPKRWGRLEDGVAGWQV